MKLDCYVQMVNFFFGLGPHLINHNAAVIKNNESSCQVPGYFLAILTTLEFCRRNIVKSPSTDLQSCK